MASSTVNGGVERGEHGGDAQQPLLAGEQEPDHGQRGQQPGAPGPTTRGTAGAPGRRRSSSAATDDGQQRDDLGDRPPASSRRPRAPGPAPRTAGRSRARPARRRAGPRRAGAVRRPAGGSRETSQMPGRATSMPTHTSVVGRSPVATPERRREQRRPDGRDRRDHAHPAAGEAAVEERGADAAAHAGQQRPTRSRPAVGSPGTTQRQQRRCRRRRRGRRSGRPATPTYDARPRRR